MINQQTTTSSGYVKSLSQTTLNFFLDVCLFLLFLASFASAYLGKSIHPWLGGGVAAVVFIHLNWHWDWIKAMGQRILKPMPVKVRVKVVLGVLLLIDFTLLAMSGFIVANIYAPNVTRFHNICMYIFVGLLLIHLALNWKWLYSKVVSFRAGNLQK